MLALVASRVGFTYPFTMYLENGQLLPVSTDLSGLGMSYLVKKEDRGFSEAQVFVPDPLTLVGRILLLLISDVQRKNRYRKRDA